MRERMDSVRRPNYRYSSFGDAAGELALLLQSLKDFFQFLRWRLALSVIENLLRDCSYISDLALLVNFVLQELEDRWIDILPRWR
jgi:hypothetical protein